jgi:glycosyltransferase involved in cell wall biosynthesis
MKIKLLVIFKSIDGGTGTYLKALLEVKKLFKKEDLSIKVLVLESPLHRSKEIGSYSFFSNKKSHSTKYNVISIFRFIHEVNWIRKEVYKFNPNVVISEDLHSIFTTEVSKLFLGGNYQTIGIIYNNLQKVIEYKTPKYLHGLIKFFVSACLNKSFLVATVSNKLSESVYNFFGLRKKPLTISTALPLAPYRKKMNYVGPGNNVISIARLDNQKDHKTLLTAFKIVITKIPDAKLWIVGDGPLRSELEKRSRNLGLIRSVKFFGWVQNPYPLLNKSDLFVLSTKWEGFGLVILEAMSHSVPVIASDCDFGPNEILGKNKYGILAPVGDSAYLARSIIKLLLNRSLNKHYSTLGYKRSKEFTQNAALAQYKRIIISASNDIHR